MSQRVYPVKGSLPLLKVVDSADNFSVFLNSFYPLPTFNPVDALEVKLEILHPDYPNFELCKRPDDFGFYFNDVLSSSITYTGALPQKLITVQEVFSVDHYLIRLRTVYPTVITNVDKPHLVLDIISTAYGGPPVNHGLVNTEMRIRIVDLAAGGFEWFNFKLNINASFNFVTVTNLNSKLLTPSALDNGAFFEVVV